MTQIDDTTRLDFLQRHKIDVTETHGSWTCYGLGVTGTDECTTAREAIDAAMLTFATNEQRCAQIELFNAAKQAANWLDDESEGKASAVTISGILKHAILRAESGAPEQPREGQEPQRTQRAQGAA